MSELVSIVMPNYNGAKYVKETIDSVLAQTYTNWEILFVDDCSKDDSVEIARSYGDPRIRILQNETNGGAATSRNYALREAKGRWIAFLDSDDLWEKDKLEKQIAFMKDNGYAFSYTDYREIDESGAPLQKLVTGPKKVTKRKMFNYGWLGCLTVMFDRDTVGLIQIPDTILKRNDYALWLKACKKATCYLYPEVLASYRRRKNSISRASKITLTKYYYKVYRESENMNAVRALYHTALVLFFGFWKKILYVKKIK